MARGNIAERVERMAARRRGLIAFDLGLDPRTATDDHIRAKDPTAVIETSEELRSRITLRAAAAEEDVLDDLAARRVGAALLRATPEVREQVYALLGLPNLSD